MSPLASLIELAAGHGLQIFASLAIWATLVLTVAWLAARSLRHSSSAVRYSVWQLGLTGLLVLPVLCCVLPGIPLGFSLGIAVGKNVEVAATHQQSIRIVSPSHVDARPQPSSPSDSKPATVADKSIDFSPPASRPALSSAAGTSPAGDPSVGRSLRRSVEADPAEVASPIAARLPLIVVCIWLLGLAVNLLWLVASALHVRNLLGSAQPLADPIFEQVRYELQPQLSSDRRVRLLTSPEIRVPAVVGFRRPRILLPANYRRWSADRIRIVLAHELAHVERQDIFWQLVARVSAAVYWFHPLVWLAIGRMKEERERSCDDRVLLAGVPAVDYATGLVDVAAELIDNEALAIGGIGMASRCELEDRLRAILDRSSCRVPASAAVRRSLAAGTAILILTLGLLRPFNPLPSSASEPAKSKPPAAAPAATRPGTSSDVSDASPGASDLSGTIRDDQGQPIAGATVRLYSAGVRGRTTPASFPSCYAACGKHATTDEEGRFSIPSLNPSLVFRLLFVAEGHKPRFTDEVDPTDGRQVDATLDIRPLPDDPACVVRGVVIDPAGKPAVGALVEPYSRQLDGRTTTVDLREIDALAVTDDAGRFALVCEEPVKSLDLRVEARGAARSNFERVPSASEKNRLALELGAAVEGRVVNNGRGVPHASIGVMQADQGNKDRDSFLGSYEVETDADGRFLLAGLPAGKELVVYGIMDSMREIGAVPTRHFTSAGRAATSLGDLPVERAYRVAGRLLRANGKPMPPHVRVLIERPNAWDRTTVETDADGHFVVTGIPAELVSISASLGGLPLPGFRLSPKNPNFEPLSGNNLRGLVTGDIDDLIVLFEPGETLRYDYSDGETPVGKAKWHAAAADYKRLATQPLMGVTAELETPATPAAEKPAANSAKPTTRAEKKNPLRVVDEQGDPVPDFEIRVWTHPLESSAWLPGRKGEIAQGQPVWGFDETKAIDLTVRADGYASTLQHFAGRELEKLKAGQATVVLQRGKEVQVSLRLPPGTNWPSTLKPVLYFDRMKNNVRSSWQSSDVAGAAPNPVWSDFDMLNFEFDQRGTATVRLTPDTAPFRVAIHSPGFLRFFDRGPFTWADVKDGKLEIEVDPPATLDVRFDAGAADGETLPLESDLISVMWKLPEMNMAFYMVAQTEGNPPRHEMRLSDLAAGEYRVDVRTKARSGIENLPDTGQVVINPGVFQTTKNVSLAVGQTERVEFPYTPFDPKAFSGDHTAMLHILNADGSPAAGRTVTVSYFGGHYGPLEVFSGTVPDSGILTLRDITDSKPDGMQHDPYKVSCGDKNLGRFGFAPASTSQEFTFHVPPAADEVALVAAQQSAPRGAQRNDPSFDATIEDPAYVAEHPRVLFDEAHHNFHTAGGRYKPFAELITSDGYRVTPNGEKFMPALLAKYDILVIANAMAEGGGGADGAESAFTEDECKAVEDWVTGGGSLLLITDFGSFGSASNLLAARFGVDMSNRVTLDPANEADQGLLFSREKHSLGDHAITNGRNAVERVNRVLTFTGQSLQGPPESVAFLKFADSAVENDGGQEISAAGRAQGIALTHGKGRVVVTGEAAQLSAQTIGSERFGMNTPGCDNRQMVLNIVHWLSDLTN